MVNIQLPKNSTILIDTNFFIDLFENKESYRDFFEAVEESDVTLVSCDLVRCEFIRTKDNEKLIGKATLFSEIVRTTLPMDHKVSELIIPTLEQYGTDLKGVSTVDIILSCFIKRYAHLYLLTANHKDFPTRILKRSNLFCVEQRKEVKTYALYHYEENEKEVEADVSMEIIPS